MDTVIFAQGEKGRLATIRDWEGPLPRVGDSISHIAEMANDGERINLPPSCRVQDVRWTVLGEPGKATGAAIAPVIKNTETRVEVILTGDGHGW